MNSLHRAPPHLAIAQALLIINNAGRFSFPAAAAPNMGGAGDRFWTAGIGTYCRPC
jgi:hypothetical protein